MHSVFRLSHYATLFHPSLALVLVQIDLFYALILRIFWGYRFTRNQVNKLNSQFRFRFKFETGQRYSPGSRFGFVSFLVGGRFCKTVLLLLVSTSTLLPGSPDTRLSRYPLGKTVPVNGGSWWSPFAMGPPVTDPYAPKLNRFWVWERS